MRKFKFRSVSLVYFLIVGLLPLFVFGGISLRHASMTLRKEILDKELYLAHSIAYPINNFIDACMDLMYFCLKTLKDKDNVYSEDFMRRIILNYDFVENIVLDDKPNERTLTISFLDMLPKEAELEKVSFKKKLLFFSGQELSPLTREIRMWLGVEEDGVRIFFSISLLKIQQLLAKAVLESGAFCMVTNEKDMIIAHPNRSLMLTRWEAEKIISLGPESVKAEALLLRKEGQLYLGVLKRIEPLPWKVMAITPTSRVFSGAYFLLKVSLLALLVALLMAVGFSLFLSGRHARSLSQLIGVAREIASGNYSVRFPKVRYRELIELAEQMEAMARALKEREEELLIKQEKFKGLYEESKRRKEVYESLLEASPDPIVIYDLEGRVTYLNPAFEETFKWNLEELKGKRIPFVPEEERHKTIELIQEMLRTGKKVKGFETKRTTKEGQVLEISISSSIYKDHTGNPAGILVILRDITENKKLESQFFIAQRLESLGTLAGGIAHNFNNILMGIQGNASLLSLDLPKQSPAQKRISNIQDLVRRAAMLTNQLLGFARGGKYQPETLEMNGLIRKTLEVFKETRDDVKIIERLWPEPLYVEGDESQMEQVLVNILENAYQAMPEGGTALVETSVYEKGVGDVTRFQMKPGSYLKITISDTGIGMEEDVKNRIFEPFFTTKPVGVGTGLGLSAVYGIVKNHGGYIDVESEKGKGSTFIIYLPLQK